MVSEGIKANYLNPFNVRSKIWRRSLNRGFLEHAKYHDRTFCENSNWLKALTVFVKSSFIDFWLGLKNDFCQGHLD